MATPEATQVSSLPLPPVQYINLYTDENVRRGRAPRPPPAIHDTYSMFGNVFNADDTIIRPLEAQGIKRLYPQHFDRRRELKKLNHSLLVNFLDLIDLLVQCPDSPRRAEKVNDQPYCFFFFFPFLWKRRFRTENLLAILGRGLESTFHSHSSLAQRVQASSGKRNSTRHDGTSAQTENRDCSSVSKTFGQGIKKFGAYRVINSGISLNFNSRYNPNNSR